MRIHLLALIVFSSNSLQAQVKKLAAETTIENVTVFSSGARVERSSVVNLQAGRTEISFAGLSNQLDQQTVQLKADANITLLSVQTTKDFLTVRKIEDDERNLIEKSGSYKDKLDMDTKLLDVYKNEESMLIKNQSIGGSTGVKTTELKDALDLQKQRLTDVYSKELEIQKRILTDQQEMERAKMQLAEISKKKDSVNYIVTALVNSKDTRTVNFHLSYNVKDAGWFATYDVRVSEVGSPLHILMNANVFQRSGETWKNISLLLSTGSPNENATPSQLQPWMLGFYDPSVSYRNLGVQGMVSGRVTDNKNQPVFGANVLIKGTGTGTTTDINGYFKLQQKEGISTLVISGVGYLQREIQARPGYFTIALENSTSSLNEVVVVGYGFSSEQELEGRAAGLDVSRSAKKKEMVQTVTTTTEYQPTTTVFKIDEKYSLETDGKTTTIGISQLEIPSIYDYYTAPKIDPTAFLTAKITNWQDYNLISGEMSLYYEGTYLGKTYMDLQTTSDTLSLSLGRDNGIKISRKLLKDYSTKKFIGSNRTETKVWEISVRNQKSVPVNITVSDQFPVSTTKEITVEDVSMPDAQVNKETGIGDWLLNLKPGEEKKLKVLYSVKYPKDRKVVVE